MSQPLPTSGQPLGRWAIAGWLVLLDALVFWLWWERPETLITELFVVAPLIAALYLGYRGAVGFSALSMLLFEACAFFSPLRSAYSTLHYQQYGLVKLSVVFLCAVALARQRKDNADLREALSLLERARRAQADLTHMIVHDLRTPLAGIIAGLKTLRRGVVGLLNLEQAHFVDTATHTAEVLSERINQLLDFHRLESGQLTLRHTAVDVKELISAAVEEVTPLLQEKSLTCEVAVEAGLPSVWADAEVLRRVLTNLLGNAIRYTPDRGGLTVSACRLAAGAGPVLARLAVTDTGPGIAPEHRDRIFDKFFQVETGSASRKGAAGLGLAFCKLAVEAHGGQIGVESEVGCGSTFFLTLPVRESFPGVGTFPTGSSIE